MIEVPHSFIRDLVEEERALDVIWNYLKTEVWAHTGTMEEYYLKNEKKASEFERFVREIFLEAYDEIAGESLKGRPRLKELMGGEEYTLIISDGFSLREANLLVESLEEHGFQIEEFTYEISHLPSETLTFTKDVLDISAPSALRTSSEWKDRSIYVENENKDYPIPNHERTLIFSRFPDAEFDKISGNIERSLSEAYKKSSEIILRYAKAATSGKIIITSDHGYCTKHPGVNWKVPDVEKEIYQEVFGLSRFKKEREIFGDMESKVKEVEKRTGRLKTVNGTVLVNGRYIWPVRGDKSRIYHGGISFMENFVPLIIASRG